VRACLGGSFDTRAFVRSWRNPSRSSSSLDALLTQYVLSRVVTLGLIPLGVSVNYVRACQGQTRRMAFLTQEPHG
jgi:hypothetical protein